MAGMDVGGGGFKNEPNVVPMIDILLVLLIIFMMQVPLQRRTMNAQVPPEMPPQSQQQKQAPQNNIVLQLGDDGGYAVNNEPVAKENLERRLREIFDPRPAKLMFLKTARSRKYQEVIEAMDIARNAGVQVIGFTPPESK